MHLKRVSVFVLLLTICLRTPMYATAVEDVPDLARQEETILEDTEDVTEKTTDEAVSDDETSDEEVSDEIAIEETADGEVREEVIMDPESSEAETAVLYEDAPEQESEPPYDEEAEAGDVAVEDLIVDEEASETVITETDEVSLEEERESKNTSETIEVTDTGWRTVKGKKYYYKSNGKQAFGITKISGAKYILDPKTGELRTGWVRIGSDVYYGDKKSGKMLIGWHTVDGNKYYFTDHNYDGFKSEKEEGIRKAGFVYIKGIRYYLKSRLVSGFKPDDLGILATGLTTVDGRDYYMDPKTGAIQTGFHEISGKLYYFSETGSRPLFNDQWRTIGGKKYYFDKNNYVQRGVSAVGTSVFNLDNHTGEATGGWKTIKGRKYYFADERFDKYTPEIKAKRLLGFRKISGKTYYFIKSEMSGYKKEDYASRATGWKTINNGRYYEDGHMQEAGRALIGGKIYVFDKNGKCTSEGTTIEDVVDFALTWVGKIPYKSVEDKSNERMMELAKGRGSDCSWFVFHCLEQYGYLSEFVHSYEWGSKPSLYSNAKSIGKDISKAKRGDIICYAYGSGKRTSENSHVAIYLGNGKQIDCSGSGTKKGVYETSVDRKNIYDIIRFID